MSAKTKTKRLVCLCNSCGHKIEAIQATGDTISRCELMPEINLDMCDIIVQCNRHNPELKELRK